MTTNCNELVTNPLHHCNEPVTGTSTQDRLGKDRLDNKKEEDTRTGYSCLLIT